MSSNWRYYVRWLIYQLRGNDVRPRNSLWKFKSSSREISNMCHTFARCPCRPAISLSRNFCLFYLCMHFVHFFSCPLSLTLPRTMTRFVNNWYFGAFLAGATDENRRHVLMIYILGFSICRPQHVECVNDQSKIASVNSILLLRIVRCGEWTRVEKREHLRLTKHRNHLRFNILQLIKGTPCFNLGRIHSIFTGVRHAKNRTKNNFRIVDGVK